MVCQLHTPRMWWHQSRHFLQSAISHNTNVPQHVTLQLISEAPPSPYVEDPTPLCDGVSLQGLWGVIWFRQGPEHGAPMMGWVSLLKRRRTKLILELCEDAVRRRPSAHRERALTRNQTTMAPWPWTSPRPELWGASVCRGSLPVHTILLWQPETPGTTCLCLNEWSQTDVL